MKAGAKPKKRKARRNGRAFKGVGVAKGLGVVMPAQGNQVRHKGIDALGHKALVVARQGVAEAMRAGQLCLDASDLVAGVALGRRGFPTGADEGGGNQGRAGRGVNGGHGVGPLQMVGGVIAVPMR